jgi:hypothetical protein
LYYGNTETKAGISILTLYFYIPIIATEIGERHSTSKSRNVAIPKVLKVDFTGYKTPAVIK